MQMHEVQRVVCCIAYGNTTRIITILNKLLHLLTACMFQAKYHLKV